MNGMLFTFENNRFAHALGGVSGVASFITTDEQLRLNRGCYFPMQAMLYLFFKIVVFKKNQLI